MKYVIFSEKYNCYFKGYFMGCKEWTPRESEAKTFADIQQALNWAASMDAKIKYIEEAAQ